MTLTLLLDLDDTLLENSMDVFVPHYLKALTGYMADHADPQQFARILMQATGVMLANDRPDHTLAETFNENFFPVIGLDYASSAPLFEAFYRDVFPTLKPHTGYRPEAVALVEQALERGYRLAVATNPLFPIAAIHHRLAWAGLPIEKYDFAVVSAYDIFHFAKPNPAYFAEILAQMGWGEGPVVMVGNDANDDIAAARSLGLAGFWITADTDPASPEGEIPCGAGGLADVLPWIDQQSPEQLMPRFNTRPALRALLKSTPAALATLVKRLPADRWTHRPTKGEWSLTEVLCHLRDVEQEVNLPRLECIMDKKDVTITGKDVARWAEERAYNRQDGQEALQTFVRARIQSLALLNNFAEQEWTRHLRHTIFSQATLQDLVSFTCRHDRLHIRQVYQSLQDAFSQPA